ncbi:MAG: alpha/beta fold hydrolase [Acidobacteriaceae bacterium]|nr:alpha/beta fold hydrolase [Acidobacteriaceae bacterium]MBV9296339.1 alpha/beta fold hydrolase [Acidobacteriaceae bacterium]MBV9766844.1 alpha/beta fold hydrolase [Acidobacteriaceae bacterium]
MLSLSGNSRRRPSVEWLALASIALLGAVTADAQSQVIEATVHSPGLEHNLLGDPADQPVVVYLPDAYRKEPNRRFPVLYFLHGYGDQTPRHQTGEMFQKVLDRLIAAGSVQPMLVVLPNGLNKYKGAFYANSSTTGNWDDYIVRDVVGYVDKNFRTLAGVSGRGIAGHSMGGYGALTLAFRHPDVFSSVYAMSPCCTDLVGDLGPSNPAWARVNQLSSPDEVPLALSNNQFFVAAFSAMDASLAPDPGAKIFGDAPFYLEGNQVKTNPIAFSRISEKLPANMVRPLLANIVQLKGIFIEYGAQENFTHIPIGAQEVSRELSEAGVPHTLEVFEGDHGNHFGQRLADRMLPWMSKQLNAEIGK